MNKNYHTHTTRCGHAKGTEREYIECAIQNGFKVLGFSDHTPQPYPDSYVSGMRMRMDQLDEYVDTLVNLRDEYKDQIKILIGLETEYYPKYFDKLHEELKARPIDYIIMGQHHVPDWLHCRHHTGCRQIDCPDPTRSSSPHYRLSVFLYRTHDDDDRHTTFSCRLPWRPYQSFIIQQK